MRFCNRLFFSLVLLALAFATGFAEPAKAADYTGAISAYRRAHRLAAVKPDSRLDAVALKQAQAMAATGSVSHSAASALPLPIIRLRRIADSGRW